MAIELTPEPLKKSAYNTRLTEALAALRTVQDQIIHHGLRVILVLEGMDAAGKGGTIRRLSQPFDPRVLKVWPIAAPKPEYRGRHYLKRFWDRLPGPGTLAVFDRSWYGRVLVERVEGFAAEAEWQRAYEELVDFETLLARDGVLIFKVFLKVGLEEQKARLVKRLTDPAKHWKITAEDFRNREKWPAYEPAITEMLAKTDHERAPWLVVSSDQKKAARIAVMEGFLDHIARHAPPPAPTMLSDEVRSYAAEHLDMVL